MLWRERVARAVSHPEWSSDSRRAHRARPQNDAHISDARGSASRAHRDISTRKLPSDSLNESCYAAHTVQAGTPMTVKEIGPAVGTRRAFSLRVKVTLPPLTQANALGSRRVLGRAALSVIFLARGIGTRRDRDALSGSGSAASRAWPALRGSRLPLKEVSSRGERGYNRFAHWLPVEAGRHLLAPGRCCRLQRPPADVK